MRSRAAAGTPGPVSLTATPPSLPFRHVVSRTVPAGDARADRVVEQVADDLLKAVAVASQRQAFAADEELDAAAPAAAWRTRAALCASSRSSWGVVSSSSLPSSGGSRYADRRRLARWKAPARRSCA
jgi:hypothetical protein